jgi:peptidyl-prolyl cis-trans isomerase D
MLQFFRSFTKSKVGIGVTLAFLVLIALAFASGDVSSSGNFGGIAGGDRVATVGSKRISTSELSQSVSSAADNLRQKDPKLTLKAFLAEGGLDQVLSEMLDRTALAAFGEKHGVIAGDRLIDSEIAKISSFRGPDGNFSDALYRQTLQQRGLTDARVREDIAQGLIARQLMSPAEYGAVIARDAMVRYAGIITERRIGGIALLPSAAFGSATPPSDQELASYYAANRTKYIQPERRTVRYASFTEAALKSVPAPTEAEIAARYSANKALYAASETRRITQLILPTEAGANAVLAEVNAGKSLEAAASSKGLSAASIGSVSKAVLSGESSQAVADASFASPSGKIVGPVRSALGWHLMRVDAAETKAARSLDQVRAELTTQLAEIKRRAALTDFSAKIEEEFDGGASLADVAKQMGLTLSETPPLTSDGRVFGSATETAPPALARVLQTAFAMEGQNEPQLAEIEAGKTFVIFDVNQLAESAPAPLAEVKQAVAIDLQLSKGVIAAKAAALKVETMVKKGTDMAAAMASLNMALPPVDRVDMPREQISGQRDLPPPLTLLFAMSKGTVKLLRAPRNRGWYVVSLKDVVPGAVNPADPRLAGLQSELNGVMGRELSQQMLAAIRAEIGVKRNEPAIRSVGVKLVGGN